MKKTRWNNGATAGLIFEKNSDSRRILVLLPGLPYVPGSQSYIEQLCDFGYVVVQPQYFGTFDSSGSFSPESAIATVASVLDSLHTGLHDVRTDEVVVAGTVEIIVAHSFGTWVLFNSLQLLSRETRILMLSPFLRMGSGKTQYGIVAELSDQANYLHAALPRTFRMRDIGTWRRFFGLGNPSEFDLASSIPLAELDALLVVGGEDAAFDVDVLRPAVAADLSSRGVNLRHGEVVVVDDAGHDAQALMDDGRVAEFLRE